MQTTDTTAERLSAIRYMWYDWRISYGAVTLTVLLSIVLGHLAVGVVTLLLAHALRLFGRSAMAPGREMHFAAMASTSLYIVGLLMVAISLLMHTQVMAKIFDPSSINEDIPYVSALIVYPSVFIVAAYNRVRLRRSTLSTSVTYTEARYLLRYTLVLSGAMSVVGWAYYYTFYINVNFNSPDRFFFYAVPLALYVLSLIYLGMRYSTEAYMARATDTDAAEAARNRCRCRCLVVHDDKLLLSTNAAEQYDTPLVGTDDIEVLIEPLRAGTDGLGLRMLYTLTEGLGQGRHYLCHIFGQRQPQQPPGQWFTISEVQQMARSRQLAPELSAEILRIYTIAMAWKTRDRNGSPKYPVKNYRPTFRLRDIYSWDVDFQDDHWLHI